MYLCIFFLLNNIFYIKHSSWNGEIRNFLLNGLYCNNVMLSLWQVFDELLLDADWSLNAGNWMWLSASAFFHQYFRVYSPVAFGKKTDPNGDYIR